MTAGWHCAAIVRDASFRSVPELVKAIEQIDWEKFAELMAYLKNPLNRRVRANNHEERTRGDLERMHLHFTLIYAWH